MRLTDPAAPSSDITCVVSGMTEGGGGEDGGEVWFLYGWGGELNQGFRVRKCKLASLV